ncbi:MAG: deoxyguanosinetriphosphate triphosphohydrolase [Pseudomonadota bacterium]
MTDPFRTIGFGAADRSPYASLHWESRGRLISEPESRTRTAFQRDRDRIIHSTAFRRLKHKTQVFIHHEGDHYRTRLTHSIEVAQIARSIARALRLDEDLAEALALAHDLGHTPFGHAGEDALEECLSSVGGFDHNAHTIRIVTSLERRYARFDGLNLTWETLEGLVKHNGPLIDNSGAPLARWKEKGVPHVIRDYSSFHDLELHTHASLEAQAAAIADDIAYNAHDIDDGLREGLFTLEDIDHVPLMSTLLKRIDSEYPGLEVIRKNHEVVRRVITELVEDVIGQSIKSLQEAAIGNSDAARMFGRPIVSFSETMRVADKGIKSFLFEKMYRTPKLNRIRENAQQILHDLFQRYCKTPEEMAPAWQEGLSGGTDTLLERRVGDYIAGMTDRFAVEEHRRMFDATPDLR